MNRFGFTETETKVANLVGLGMSNKEVATQLFVVEKTVKYHLGSIYKKMALKSLDGKRAALVELIKGKL